MKSFLKTIKKHKLLILLLILVVILIAFCAKLVFIFTESDEKAFYGRRLVGEEKVAFDSKKYNTKVKEKLGDQVKNVTIRTQGRIINIILNIKAETARDAAKDLANQVVNELKDKEKEYYDIQIYINKEDESEDKAQFPIMGYRHHTKDNITWTKDR